MPHLSCAVCGYSREPSLTELQRSLYWPGNIPASTLFNTDVLVSFCEMKMVSPGISFQAFVKMLDEKTIIFGRVSIWFALFVLLLIIVKYNNYFFSECRINLCLCRFNY